MGIPILTVDQDLDVYARERAGWLRHGIDIVRADSMSEAIERLCYANYRLVTINADNTRYLPLLPVMRETTAIPIFIITSRFTIEEQVKALHAGADVFAPFQNSVEDNILSALALMHRYSSQRQPGEKPIICRGLVIDSNLHLAFVNEQKLDLTPIEFKILYYLAANRGRALTKEQIYCHAWEDDNCLDVDGVVSFHVFNIRHKIAEYTEESYIETVWGVGFRLIDTG